MRPNNPVLLYQRKHSVDREINRYANSPVVINNKLEALKMLASSILTEVSSLKQYREAVASDIDLAKEVQQFESDLIRCALVRTGGNQRKAARLLKIKPTTLHEKMKRYGVISIDKAVEDESFGNLEQNLDESVL
jgi:transcriptional regulator with GAF, ATPase, and Fis domain